MSRTFTGIVMKTIRDIPIRGFFNQSVSTIVYRKTGDYTAWIVREFRDGMPVYATGMKDGKYVTFEVTLDPDMPVHSLPDITRPRPPIEAIEQADVATHCW